MLTLESIQHSAPPKPPKLVIYGAGGVGKSTLAAKFPAPIFVQTEDGLGTIDTPRFPQSRTLGEVIEALSLLYNEQHQYQTVVIDSADWLEPLIWADVCAEKQVKHIDDLGYGKGYAIALDRWTNIIQWLDYLNIYKGMAVVIIAHGDVKTFNDPQQPYDRWTLKLHQKAAGKLVEFSDAVLFGKKHVAVMEKKEGFSKEKKTYSNGTRLLHTEDGGIVAKNRFNMPTEIPMDFEELKKYIPYYKG